MTTRPVVSPLIATDATLGTGAESALSPRLDPGAGIRARGLLANTRAPARWFNFFLGLLGDWADYLDQKTKHDFNVLNYGADPTGVADSTAAIQAAISAAFAAGGGDALAPPGIYKRSILTLRSGVNLRGVGNATTLRFTGGGATNGLVFIDNLQGPTCEVSDIQFDGDAVNTGTSVVNNSGRRVIFRNCTWNAASGNLQGELALVNSASSELIFIDCGIKVSADVNGLHVLSGSIKMLRGSLVMPATYNQTLMRAEGSSRVSMIDVDVNCTARTVGGGVAVILADAGATVSQIGCRVDGTAAVGTIYGCLWTAGARILAKANDWIGNIVPYGGNTAVAGSSIELKEYTPAHPGPATTYTIPNGVRNVALAFNGTAPTLTMPAKLFAGQRIGVSIFNDGSGGNWSGVTVIGLSFAEVNAINNNMGRSFEAMAVDRNLDGTLDWVTVGAWSGMFI